MPSGQVRTGRLLSRCPTDSVRRRPRGCVAGAGCRSAGRPSFRGNRSWKKLAPPVFPRRARARPWGRGSFGRRRSGGGRSRSLATPERGLVARPGHRPLWHVAGTRGDRGRSGRGKGIGRHGGGRTGARGAPHAAPERPPPRTRGLSRRKACRVAKLDHSTFPSMPRARRNCLRRSRAFASSRSAVDVRHPDRENGTVVVDLAHTTREI